MERQRAAPDRIQPDGDGELYRVAWRSHAHTGRRWQRCYPDEDFGGIFMAIQSTQCGWTNEGFEDQSELRWYPIHVLRNQLLLRGPSVECPAEVEPRRPIRGFLHL